MVKILVIDDDPLVLELVQARFESAGYDILTASDGEFGLRRFGEFRPDLVILDIIMPHMNGWEACRQIRAISPNIPIVMLTGLEGKDHIVEGLNLGADDYIVKPFHIEELHARIEAVLRRRRMPPPPTTNQFYFENGDFLIDAVNRRVVVRGEAVHLTPIEYDLLLFLVRRAGRILSTSSIFDKVWPYDTDAGPESVKWYIWRLRKKIEADPDNPRYILTEHGFGYRFPKL